MATSMHDEILSQQRALVSALDAVDSARNDLLDLLGGTRRRDVLFLGMGSSHLVGAMAAPLWRRGGWAARAVPAAEPLLRPEVYPVAEGTVVIATSRSGSTPETLDALRLARDRGARSIALTVSHDTALAAGCDLAIVAPEGAESNPPQTRSVTAHLIAAQSIALLAAGDADGLRALRAAAAPLGTWVRQADDAMRIRAGGFERAYILGSADRWAAAAEGAMKLKECARLESEAFQSLDFRHGPLTMVDEETLVIGLITASARAREVGVLREAAAAGAQVLAIADEARAAADQARAGADDVPGLRFSSGLAEALQTVFYLPPLQLLAWHRARADGLDPSHLRNLRNLH